MPGERSSKPYEEGPATLRLRLARASKASARGVLRRNHAAAAAAATRSHTRSRSLARRCGCRRGHPSGAGTESCRCACRRRACAQDAHMHMMVGRVMRVSWDV